METFFRLDEMLIALDVAKESGLPLIATMSFRPLTSASSDDRSPAECAKAMADAGAIAVGANCEQEPSRMLEIMRAMRGAVDVPLAAQPAAFRTTRHPAGVHQDPRVSRRSRNGAGFPLRVLRLRQKRPQRRHRLPGRMLRRKRQLPPGNAPGNRRERVIVVGHTAPQSFEHCGIACYGHVW